MKPEQFQIYTDLLKRELVPAMGCTEPIAVAYAAALARRELGCEPQRVKVLCSANIIKNVKSVVVPHTGGKHGIVAAAAAGIVLGDAGAQLQVLSRAAPEDVGRLDDFLASVPCQVEPSGKPYVFHIQVELSGGGHTALSEIAGRHTNVIRLERDGKPSLVREYWETASPIRPDPLTVEGIVEFAQYASMEDLRETFQRQIDYNTAIAREGLSGNWGACIGKTLLRAYGNSVHNRAKAMAAAGSDARMNGCELPVVINSGSGNQGMTASLPVIVYAEELGSSREELYRALAVSNLITLHLKSGIGSLSAYCGAVSAGCGAGAGVCWLYGGRFREIAHTVVNAVAIDSGLVCDGAKASCAAKIASAVEAGLLGFQMQQSGHEFYGGDGIVEKGVENTIRNIATLASVGMRETDRTIVRLMTGNGC